MAKVSCQWCPALLVHECPAQEHWIGTVAKKSKQRDTT